MVADTKKFISLAEAASQTPYSQEYLSLRARQKKLRAVRRGRNWMTTEEWVNDYIKNYASDTKTTSQRSANAANGPVKKEPAFYRESDSPAGGNHPNEERDSFVSVFSFSAPTTQKVLGSLSALLLGAVLIFSFANPSFGAELKEGFGRVLNNMDKIPRAAAAISDVIAERKIVFEIVDLIEAVSDDLALEAKIGNRDFDKRIALEKKRFNEIKNSYKDSVLNIKGAFAEAVGNMSEDVSAIALNFTDQSSPSSRNLSDETASLFSAFANLGKNLTSDLGDLYIKYVGWGVPEYQLAIGESIPLKPPAAPESKPEQKFEIKELVRVTQIQPKEETTRIIKEEVVPSAKLALTDAAVGSLQSSINLLNTRFAQMDSRLTTEEQKPGGTVINNYLTGDYLSSSGGTLSGGLQVMGNIIGGRLANQENLYLTSTGGNVVMSAGSSIDISGKKITLDATDSNEPLITLKDPTIFQLAVTFQDLITQTSGKQITLSGNIDAQNGLDVTGANFTVGGTKLTIDPATGDLVTAGNFTASGNAAITGNLSAVNLTGSGNLTISGGTTLGSTTASALVITGNTTLGDATSDDLSITSRLVSSFLPKLDANIDLGSSALRFNNIYALTINTAGTNTSSQATFTLDPTNTNITSSSVFINPTTADANEPLLGIGLAGSERFRVDVEGDVSFVGSATIGNASADTLTLNAATITSASPMTWTLDQTSISALNIDSNTLVIDASNNRIGIGTTSPAEALELASGKNIRLANNTQIQLGDTVTDNSSITSRLSLQRLETTGTFPGRGPGGTAATGLYLQIPQPNSRVLGLMIGPEPSPVGRITEGAPFAFLVNGDVLMGDIFSIGSLPISAFVRQTTQTSVVGTVLMSNTSTITDGTGGGSITLDSDANPVGVNNNAGSVFLTAFGRGTGVNANSIVFQTRSGASAVTQRAVLDGNGNFALGIGAVDSARLHVFNNASTTLNVGEFEAAVAGYTGTSLIASNTLGATSTYNLFSAITDSDGDAGGPVTQFVIRGDGRVGIGTTSPAARLDVTATTEQLRLSYNASNYSSFTIGSTGDLTIAPSGGDTTITGTLTTSSTLTTQGALSVQDNTTLGDASTDTLTLNARAITSASPTTWALANVADALNIDSNTLSIDALNNRVGIGIASPEAKLDVTGTDVDHFFRVSNAGAGGASYDFVVSRTGSGSAPAGSFWISKAGASPARMLIDTNGNVGIWTTGPDSRLDVLATSGSQLRLTYTDGSVYSDFTVNSAGDLTIAPSGGDTSITGNLAVSGTITGSFSPTNLSVTGNTTLGDASVDTLTLNAAAITSASPTTWALANVADALNIDSNTLSIDALNNRVGIGTTSPSVKLEVNTTGASAANLSVGRFFATDLGSGYYSVISTGSGTGAANNFSLGFTEDTTDANTYGFLSVSGDDPAAGAGLVIKKGGNVGVGTTSPGYKFDVNGDANVGQLSINGGTSAGDEVLRILPPATATTAGTQVFGMNIIPQTTTVIGADRYLANIERATLTAASAVTVPTATTLRVVGAPIAGTNVTITTPLALSVDSGVSYFGGNVGIGTTSPASRLSVAGNGGDANGALRIANANYNRHRDIFMSSTDSTMSFNNGTNAASLSDAGVWESASDIAYKKDIEPIKYGLATVMALQPRHYRMKDNNQEQIGFIAQEVKELVPEVVGGEEGHLTLSYGQLTAVLAKAIQEQQKQIEELSSQLSTNLTVTQNLQTGLLEIDILKVNTIQFANGNTIRINSDGFVEIETLAVGQLKVKSGGAVSFAAGTDEVSGSGIVLNNTQETTVANANIIEGAKVFITFEGNPGAGWWVERNTAAAYFTVKLAAQASQDLRFQYLILKTNESEISSATTTASSGDTSAIGAASGDTATIDTITGSVSSDTITVTDASSDTITVTDASSDTITVTDVSSDTITVIDVSADTMTTGSASN